MNISSTRHLIKSRDSGLLVCQSAHKLRVLLYSTRKIIDLCFSAECQCGKRQDRLQGNLTSVRPRAFQARLNCSEKDCQAGMRWPRKDSCGFLFFALDCSEGVEVRSKFSVSVQQQKKGHTNSTVRPLARKS